LTPSSGYSFKAYAKNLQGTSYSAVDTFSSKGPPTVTSPTAVASSATSQTLGGTVASDNGFTITERGVVYALTSVNPNPLLLGTGVPAVTTSGTTGVFTVEATGLATVTGYSYRAYATNSSGTTYSGVATFTTATLPTITSPTSSAITNTTARPGGNVTSDG